MPKAIAVVEDLFFTVKILESAKRAGLAIEFVKSQHDAIEKAREHPSVMVIDLNFDGVDPVGLIGNLKSAEDTKNVPLIGYVSHVQGELKQAAQRAGCNQVMPRSAFSLNLAQIFQRHAGAR
jgi:CheY-like chemotaxis protein